MDEGRKQTLDSLRRSPAFEAVVADALSTAERIMQRIDARFAGEGKLS